MLSSYVVAPFLGYVVAGGLKFLINSIKLKKLAFKAMGLGGFPSTHNTVTTTVVSLLTFKEGFSSPALSVALALFLIVAIDSINLRKAIEAQAKLLVKLNPEAAKKAKIRERIGHSRVQAIAGICLGCLLGYFLFLLDF